MNLHHLVRPAVGLLNPDIPAVLHRNCGYSTDAAGQRQPLFDSMQGNVQVQAVNGSDLQHSENLNLQGVLRTVFLYGNWYGVVRAGQQGGDMLQFADVGSRTTQDWRIVQVLESWPQWSKVLVCLQ